SGIMHDQHACLDATQHLVGAMQLTARVATQTDVDEGMTATFHQAHTADVRVGSFAVLIAAASKSRLIAWRITRIEDRAINGHQPHPVVESAFRLWRAEQTTA